MFNDTLVWTMRMKTDKQGFKDAFYKVIDANGEQVMIDLIPPYYYGRIYAESGFNIFKRGEHAPDRLKGKISEDANGLLLELHLQPSFNRTRFVVLLILASVVLSYAIAEIPFVNDFIADFFLLGVGLILIPVLTFVYRLVKRLRSITSLGIKARFIDVLNEIEKEVGRSKN